jgi:sortase A
VRILDRLGAPGDPLLRFGVAAMAFSVLCASLVAAYALLRDGPGSAKADPAAVKAASAEPLVRSDPGVEPWKEETVPQPREEKPPPPEPEKETAEEPQRAEEPAEGLEPSQQPEPSLPVADEDWPMPTAEQVAATREPRRYDLPRGAALGLTVPSIDLYDAPVLRANSQKALDNGVVHLRGSSMPGSDTPDRNVYLAAHRLGWPGTGSHLIFYRLNELGEGDEISLKSREGKRYDYRITDAFVVNPEDVWVTGRIPGRDMLTLQTCTPIPGFEKRLIVRAERV